MRYSRPKTKGAWISSHQPRLKLQYSRRMMKAMVTRSWRIWKRRWESPSVSQIRNAMEAVLQHSLVVVQLCKEGL